MPIFSFTISLRASLLFAVLLLGLSLLGVHLSPTGHAATPARSSSSFEALVKDFESLCADSVKGSQRHPWQNLEKKFTHLSGKSSGDAKVQSAYYAARCLDELSKRSFVRADYKVAADRYAKVAKGAPTHALAPVCLYEAAFITVKRLNNPSAADTILTALLKNFPKGEVAGKAKKLQLDLMKTEPAVSDAAKGANSAAASGQAGSRGAGSAQSRSTQSRAEQLGLTVKTIMIDPGHGGKDPGAEVQSYSERDLTLTMATILGDALKKNGFAVIYTRKTNSYLPLEKRTDLANNSKADIFISIHANANTDSRLHGLETYFLAKAESTNAAKVAARENSVSEKQVNDVQFIVADLMLNSKLKESKALAGMVHKGVLARVKKGKFTLHDNGVRPAPFYVLMGAKVPAILLEMGYMTNADDLLLLNNRSFLVRQADGIVQGIKEYREYVAKGID